MAKGEELGVRPRRRRPAHLNSRFQTNPLIELYLRPKIRIGIEKRALVLCVNNMNASVSGRESLNGGAKSGCDLLEIDIFDGKKSVRAKN